MRTLAISAILFVIALMIGHNNAKSANWSDTRIDAAASEVAGHPVTVYCENDMTQWTMSALGYTSPWADNIVHIHPVICRILHLMIDGDKVTTSEAAEAIHVLVHESVHQRDGIYADCTATDKSCEGRTDCMALSLDVGVAVKYFGFPTKIKKVTKRKVKHRVVKVIRWVTNPELKWFEWDTVEFHRALPVAYQGGC